MPLLSVNPVFFFAACSYFYWQGNIVFDFFSCWCCGLLAQLQEFRESSNGKNSNTFHPGILRSQPMLHSSPVLAQSCLPVGALILNTKSACTAGGHARPPVQHAHVGRKVRHRGRRPTPRSGAPLPSLILRRKIPAHTPCSRTHPLPPAQICMEEDSGRLADAIPLDTPSRVLPPAFEASTPL